MQREAILPRIGAVLLALVCGCATLADAETGGENLPNAAAGPFRALRSGELGNLRSAPNALEDDETFPRDAAILDADGDPATFEVFGYFAVNPRVMGEEPDPTASPRAIVRYAALDGRSFDRAPITVLEPAEPWEGSSIGEPAVLRVGDEVFLYYAAASGIGLAKSKDGLTFVRESKPVLEAVSGGWEAGAVPQSPGVVQLEDGSFRLFYEASGKIGEARSSDGVAWERVGQALAPKEAASTEEEPPDSAWVGSPFPVIMRSSEGRAILRLYYGARNSVGKSVIGLASRFEPMSEEAFARATSPVFGSGSSLGPGEPCVLVWPSMTLLFTTQRAGRTKSDDYPAVAAAVAPGNATLPLPSP